MGERRWLRRCVHGLAWLVVLAYVGGSAFGASAASIHWSGELVSSLTLYIGLGGLVLALLLFAARVKAAALIALVVALAQLAPVARLYVPNRGVVVAAERTLKVASVNVFMRNEDGDGFRTWVERESPDVLAVLEVTPYWKGVLEGMAEHYPHQRIELQYGESWERANSFGIAFLSRRPWSRLDVHRFRNVVFDAELEVDGEPVLVRALHAPVPVRPWLLERRDALYARVASELPWPEHAVLIGDMNATMYSPSLRRLARETGLRDSRAGFGWLPSWRSNYKVHGVWIAIDHILAGPGLDVVERYNGRLAGSDHRPVVAVLSPRP